MIVKFFTIFRKAIDIALRLSYYSISGGYPQHIALTARVRPNGKANDNTQAPFIHDLTRRTRPTLRAF